MLFGTGDEKKGVLDVLGSTLVGGTLGFVVGVSLGVVLGVGVVVRVSLGAGSGSARFKAFAI